MQRRPVLTVLVALVLTLAACATPTQGDAADEARIAIGTDPSTFDPAAARATDDYTVARLLYDTLLRRDDDGTLVPGLAESWTAIDAATYTLVIRPDARCADGTPITAGIVAASLGRLLDPATGSTARSLVIGGGEATVTADDPARTVTVSLSEPWSDLPVGLTLPQAGIVCPAGIADPEGLAAGTAAGAASGPYTLSASRVSVAYTLALREDYDQWPAFAEPLTGSAPRRLQLVPTADQSTAATQLLAHGLDVATLSDRNVTRLDGVDGFTTATSNNASTYLLFNQREGSIFADDPALRTAVAQLVDRSAFDDLFSQGRGEVLDTVSSPATTCASDDDSLLVAQDPEAARTALDGVRIRLVGPTGAFEQGVAYLAEVLRSAGAEVDLDLVDNATWSTRTGGGGSDWDLTLQADLNLTGTLTSSLLRAMGPVTEDGGRNKTGDESEDGYRDLRAALATTDGDERCTLLASAQERMLQDVDVVPLASMPTTLVVDDRYSVRVHADDIDLSTLRTEP